jgi:hypothetical protein
VSPTIDRLATVVEATRAQGTARVAQSFRLGEPIPDPKDIRAEGLVDFSRDRLWLKERFITRRMATARSKAGLVARLVNLPLHLLLNRLVGGGNETYYEGGAKWTVRKDGSLRSPSGTIRDPKNTWNPLFLLDALTDYQNDIKEVGSPEIVRGAPTTRYELALTSDQFDPSLWAQLAEIQSADKRSLDLREAVQRRDFVAALLWIDEELRIRRMSYESVYYDAQPPSWAITEFWDFGVTPDRLAPTE